MDTINTIQGRRTIRKYKQDKIHTAILREVVDGARLAPSAANRQPLEYLVVDDPTLLEKVFETLGWAGYLKPQGTPKEGEKPVAYIIILVNTDIGKEPSFDVGAAAQNILLGAWAHGIGSCWFRSVNRNVFRDNFSIPSHYDIDTVIALGYPAEKSIWEDEKGCIKYYKDENNVLHVPKRKLDDILYWNEGFGG